MLTMQDFSISTLIEMTIGLASGLNDQDRFNRLLDAIRKTIQCDCVMLLSRQGDLLIPLAMQGLTRDTLGRRFLIDEHPRFSEICHADGPVIFDANSSLPDPFDGLLMDHDGDLPMHSCMGLPLLFGDKLLGILTLDSLNPNMFEHIPKRSLEALSAIAASTLKMALTFSQLEAQAKQSQQRLEELNEEAWDREGGEIIGSSASMLAMKADLEVVAPSNFNILIHGETGVGKELVARTLHQLSARKRQPLIYVNCAAIPENLVESELFGHVKGAFTGAERHRLGKFALADGGTLFLDEIGELPLAAQSKILRALQNNEIQPVGQDHVQTIDVRILAATNRDLKQEVEAGRFRADLYHRLSVYPVHIPPLRERNGDVTLLAGYFLEQARRKLGITQLKIDPNALAGLLNYSWPGNVRELEHVINRAALKARARQGLQALITVNSYDIGELDFSLPLVNTQSTLSGKEVTAKVWQRGLREATDEYQRKLISEALTQSDFNWAKAGRLLQVDRANLTRLSKRLGISVKKTHAIER
ncbi:nitric oxide reductase transcriptional regulator NorR [Vibrio anguillarum]|nr:nitric oxide reductase transcriptional regulator NorR [Vibrio anguillarum]MBF4277498.1 nitric oxide reductase transcriptional regulator NorR [Vibrio anguillarum]MBF4299193.1 nitric oxide reductase transcriptional regulator NorR [Vibrio anguillarum]MBF4361568.1 nitric oxide reductase transcriptional regulator NorR [Vibrio anguillarum]MBF4396464.1 nitric oxide reductase transcriptional regulator NorR [Vibrio anguillarum]